MGLSWGIQAMVSNTNKQKGTLFCEPSALIPQTFCDMSLSWALERTEV